MLVGKLILAIILPIGFDTIFNQMNGESLFGSGTLELGNSDEPVPVPVPDMETLEIAANETVTTNSTNTLNETLTSSPEILYPPPTGLDIPATNGTNSTESFTPPAYNETMPTLNDTLSANDTDLFPPPEPEQVSPPSLVSPPAPTVTNETSSGNSTSPTEESPGLEPVESPPTEESPSLQPAQSPPEQESPALEPIDSTPDRESPALGPGEPPQVLSPPPPPIQGGPGGDTCSGKSTYPCIFRALVMIFLHLNCLISMMNLDLAAGYAYSGYMTRCQVYIDANQDATKTVGEPSDTTNEGYFSIAVPSSNFQGFIVRLDPADSDLVGPVSAGSQVCHDMATLLPQRLPLASPIMQRCDGSSPIAITSLSTLLTVPGVTESSIRELFSLHESVMIGQQDYLRVRFVCFLSITCTTGSRT